MQDTYTPEERETRESYDILAPNWDEYAGKHGKDDNWRAFTRHLPRGSHVLDIGCGNGRDAALFLSDGFQYTGIDFSFKMLEEARRKNAEVPTEMAAFVEMDARRLAFRDECFDAFWATTTLMHIHRRKLLTTLLEVKRVLKPRGVGFISIPNGSEEKMYEGSHNTGMRTLLVQWDTRKFSRVLVDAQLELLYMYQFKFMHFFLVRKPR